jgi:hypothetical protein
MDIIALAEEVGVEFAFPTRTVHVQPASGQITQSGDTEEGLQGAAPREAAGLG